MKKIFITLTLLLCIVMSTQAQYFNNKDGKYYGGGLFCRGLISDEAYYGAYQDNNMLLFNNLGLPGIPGHELDDDQPSPVGSGVMLLLSLGVAYTMVRKRKDNQ